MKHLYALLTRNCDLHCPHCGVAEYKNETYNEEKVLETIKDFDGTVTLFGGSVLFMRIDSLKHWIQKI